MKKSTKIWLKIASAISAILILVFLCQAVCLMFNIAGYKEFYIGILKQMGMVNDPSEINFQVSMSIFDSVVGILLNSYAAGVYFKLSKSDHVIVGSSKVLLNIAILQCFFIISILPGIIAIVVSVKIRKQEENVLSRQRPSDSPQSQMDNLSNLITSLRNKKENGEISEDEYNKILSELIEKSVRENCEKEQFFGGNTSLKDRIISLKEKSKTETLPENKTNESTTNVSDNTQEDDKKDNE